MVPIADIENKMFELINQSRVAEGLDPYLPYVDDTLATVARNHSNLILSLRLTNPNACIRGDRLDGHWCPEAGELKPEERLDKAGVVWTAQQECVGNAWAETTLDPFVGLDIIHQKMMRPSDPHRPIILSSTLKQVGVGVAFDGSNLWVTENFIRP
jgi:hypothetical protein